MDTSIFFAPIALLPIHDHEQFGKLASGLQSELPVVKVFNQANREDHENKNCLEQFKYTIPIEPIYQAAIRRRLSFLSFLKPNWNGDGADIPNEQTFFQANRFIEVLPVDLLQYLSDDNIHLTPYGTIVMDFQKTNGDLISIEVGKDKVGFFTEFTEGGNENSPGDKIGTNGIPDKILPVFKKFVEQHN